MQSNERGKLVNGTRPPDAVADVLAGFSGAGTPPGRVRVPARLEGLDLGLGVIAQGNFVVNECPPHQVGIRPQGQGNGTGALPLLGIVRQELLGSLGCEKKVFQNASRIASRE